MKKTKYLFLIKLSNGCNQIDEDECDEAELSEVEKEPGIRNFWKFLQENHLDYHKALLELAQVLKVPVERMLELGKAGEEGKGFITGDAQINIRDYLEDRISPAAISFLECQEGDAGKLNNYRPKNEQD